MLIPIISAVQDTFSHKNHTVDFIYARSDYMRLRIKTIVGIFLILIPIWTLLDWYLLPIENMTVVMTARVIMVALFAFVYFANERKWRSPYTSIWLSYLVITIPALFYLLVLFIADPTDKFSLVGYSFIPFFLVGTLSIFPFTVIESLLMGTVLLLLQILSFSFRSEPLFVWENTQNIWLLAAFLLIVITTNHFHLSLLLRLYRQATYDPLTGLLNRITLSQHIKQIQSQLQREAIAILFIDLDFFKNLNDKYGHSVGDEVLRTFSAILKKCTARSDVVYRYGGEEFLIICQNSSSQKAMQLAEKIRRETEKTAIQTHDQASFYFTTSIGVALLGPKESVESAISRADQRLYIAKSQGRNRVVYK